MPLAPGEPAPWITAPTPSSAAFPLDNAAGRYVLLAFLPTEYEALVAAIRLLAKYQPLFDDARLAAFGVVREPNVAATLKDVDGLRWFLDLDGAISRRFGALDENGVETPHWLLLDPTLRAIGFASHQRAKSMFDFIRDLPPVEDHAGVPLHAPVLIAPRIFEPELCTALIALHDGGGAEFSGVMRDSGDRTLAVMDTLKKRRDVKIEDEALQAALRERLERRLFPLVERSLGFTATRIERYLVSAYDVEDGGVFPAHRDSVTHATAHRKFAASINLNDDFEGGDLRFAEFGQQTYRAPVGGAVVFSGALMHEVTRVTAGRRHAFLTFLYDEAGAATRAAYEARVAEQETA